jgi:hypothetical protein
MPTVLPIQMQKQCCSHWCWAAVISSVTQGLTTPCGKLQQGEVVTQTFGTGVDCTGCCPNGCPDLEDSCDLPADISFALSKLQLGFSAGQAVGAIGFDGICQQLAQQRPVVAQIDFDDPPGGTHALLIYGCDGTDSLRIGDPSTGETLVVSFAFFSTPEAFVDSSTQVHGTWSTVYVMDGL